MMNPLKDITHSNQSLWEHENPLRIKMIQDIKASAASYGYTALWVHENPDLSKMAYELGIFEECCLGMKGSNSYLALTNIGRSGKTKSYLALSNIGRRKTKSKPKRKPIIEKTIKATASKSPNTTHTEITLSHLELSLFNDCKRSALKYTDANKWVHENPNLAQTAFRLKFFNHCCKHMTVKKCYLDIVSPKPREAYLPEKNDEALHQAEILNSDGFTDGSGLSKYSLSLCNHGEVAFFIDSWQSDSDDLTDDDTTPYRESRYDWFKAHIHF